jgi:hypothetical protein
MQNFFVKSHGLGNDYIVLIKPILVLNLTKMPSAKFAMSILD